MRKSGYKLKSRARLVFVIVLALTLLAGGGLYALGFLDELLYDMRITDTLPESKDDVEERINILALGVDAREGENKARTDTMMLCSVDTEKNLMSVLSIPRDTRVYIPGHGYEKINSATLYGGPDLAMKTVSDLLGIKINKYVLTDFQGFEDIVDSLGGVTMDIKQRMYHYDPQDGGIYTIDLRPGEQRLDGKKALQYVRYRGYALGDIDRTEHQQKFMAALSREVLQPSTVVKLPSLAISIYKAVDTNLSLSEMTRLAQSARKLTNANIVSQTLPGKFLNLDGGSYWEVDPNEARLVIAGIMEGRAADKVVLGTKTVNTGSKASEGVDSGGVIPPLSGQESSVKDNSGTSAVLPGTSSGTGSKKPPAGTSGGVSKTGSSTKDGSTTTSKTSKSTNVTQPPASMVVPGTIDQDGEDSGSGASVTIKPRG